MVSSSTFNLLLRRDFDITIHVHQALFDDEEKYHFVKETDDALAPPVPHEIPSE